MCQDAYQRLAIHLSVLGMGLPIREELIAILKANISLEEAEVALLLPTRVMPLEVTPIRELVKEGLYSEEKLERILESLADRGLLFSGTTSIGERGYALQQVGFGFPQTFFWSGEDTPHARNMTNLLAKYFSRDVTREAFGASQTKPSRYIPVSGTIAPDQAVYPFHMMEGVIKGAKVFAVTHCPCRVQLKMRGGKCEHPEEVCLKFDDMAQYVIDRGFGKEISGQEALEIIKLSEEAGLVHFVDNSIEGIKHNCNCCGCACWNVGSIKRRKIPRDVLMATYFMRETNKAKCSGCGICVEVCPVAALKIEGDYPVVDEEWCIGCGVCVSKCPSGAAELKYRKDVEPSPPLTFTELHTKILMEKGLK